MAVQSSVESILQECNKPLDALEAKCAHSLEQNSVVRVSLLELLKVIQEEHYYTTVQTLHGLISTLSQLQDGGMELSSFFFSCFEKKKKKKRHTHRDAYLVVTTFQAGLGCGSLTASTLDAIDAYETAVENNELSSSLIRMISRQAVQVYSDAFLSLVRKAEIGDPHAQLPLSICSDSFGTKEVWRNADSPEEGVMVRVQIVHWIAVVAHLTQMLVLRLGRSQFKVCPKSSWPRRLWPIKGEIVQTVATQTLVKIETAFQSCQTPNSECDETEASRDADTREEQQSERWSGKQPSSR